MILRYFVIVFYKAILALSMSYFITTILLIFWKNNEFFCEKEISFHMLYSNANSIWAYLFIRA